MMSSFCVDQLLHSRMSSLCVHICVVIDVCICMGRMVGHETMAGTLNFTLLHLTHHLDEAQPKRWDSEIWLWSYLKVTQ